jgi:hypothetical protein
MSVRRIELKGAAQPELGREKPRKQRLGLLFLLSLGGGTVAGAVAFMIIWIPTVFALANANTPVPQLAAKSLFPPAAPLHQTINITDPPVYRAPAPATSVPASPSPSPAASPSPSPRPSSSPRPTPSATPGDN